MTPSASLQERNYVLVTPTKNEEALIGHTLKSVVEQKVRPAEWIIVSDGSTDRTEALVAEVAAANPWIKLVKLPPRQDRNFAAVVRATEAGCKALTVSDYHYIGLLDSDVRFGPDYFEKVLEHFEMSPRLGLAGGLVIDPGDSPDRLPFNRDDVPGAVQFFRRSCFEKLGGLLAIPEGGWDALTCARARMCGYDTRLLVDLVVDHLKPRSVAEGGRLRRLLQMGVRDYALGYHPLFETVKCLGRIRQNPLLIGAMAWWFGYWSATLKRRPRLIPEDLLRFVRAEQWVRLKRLVGLRGSPKG